MISGAIWLREPDLVRCHPVVCTQGFVVERLMGRCAALSPVFSSSRVNVASVRLHMGHTDTSINNIWSNYWISTSCKHLPCNAGKFRRSELLLSALIVGQRVKPTQRLESLINTQHSLLSHFQSVSTSCVLILLQKKLITWTKTRRKKHCNCCYVITADPLVLLRDCSVKTPPCLQSVQLKLMHVK